MAKSKKELNPLTDKPANKLEVTKAFMLGFMQQRSDEEKKWFAGVVQENIVEKTAPNSDKKVKTYDLAKVREEFCKKYFINLIKKSNAEEELEAILSWL